MTNLLTMDPAEAVETESFDVLNNLYDRLIEMDPVTPSKIVPGLAEKWTIAEDGTITFNLRSDAKFSFRKPGYICRCIVVAEARDEAKPWASIILT